MGQGAEVEFSQSAQQINSSSRSSDRTTKTEIYQQQCIDCLKNSVTRASSPPKLDTIRAIEQINMLRQTTHDDALIAKLGALATAIEQADPISLTHNRQIQEFVSDVFAQQDRMAKAASVNIARRHLNKTTIDKNPFAPKVPEASKAKKTDLHKEDPSDKAPQEQKNEKGVIT